MRCLRQCSCGVRTAHILFCFTVALGLVLMWLSVDSHAAMASNHTLTDQDIINNRLALATGSDEPECTLMVIRPAGGIAKVHLMLGIRPSLLDHQVTHGQVTHGRVIHGRVIHGKVTEGHVAVFNEEACAGAFDREAIPQPGPFVLACLLGHDRCLARCCSAVSGRAAQRAATSFMGLHFRACERAHVKVIW